MNEKRNKRVKVALIFGTRPEAVKLVSLVNEFKRRSDRFDTRVIITGQHRQMLDPILRHFGVTPDYDLNLMRHNQTLFQITAGAIEALEKPLAEIKPDIALVQGDTTTTFAGALASYYLKIPVGHVEAGLRTGDPYSPFPEEMNRMLTGRLASIHFCPTEKARANLLREGVDPATVHVTGNTGVDTLMEVARSDAPPPVVLDEAMRSKKLIVLTLHRRESFGEPIRRALETIAKIARERRDVGIIYPVHLNPNVKSVAVETLGDIENVKLIEPLDYVPFVKLLSAARLILTDSGGIQEEAPSLKVPVMVMREVTERQEAVEAGTAVLVGTDPAKIERWTMTLLDDEDARRKMTSVDNPFGDGRACPRIADIVDARFGG